MWLRFSHLVLGWVLPADGDDVITISAVLSIKLRGPVHNIANRAPTQPHCYTYYTSHRLLSPASKAWSRFLVQQVDLQTPVTLLSDLQNQLASLRSEVIPTVLFLNTHLPFSTLKFFSMSLFIRRAFEEALAKKRAKIRGPGLSCFSLILWLLWQDLV